MKERPILFSAPMVQAILEGRKTMTRRMVRFPKDYNGGDVYDNSPYGIKYSNSPETVERLFCPYGQPGDRLWVRETWAYRMDYSRIYYKADENFAAEFNRLNDKWKPSIFMPRTASRITLEITSVLVKLLQDITDEDALLEGCYQNNEWSYHPGELIDRYRKLWQSINGKESWIENPWVWVIEFKRI